MSRPKVLTPDHGCVLPLKQCRAVRCTNGCGEFEHKKPAELSPECLRHDLAVAYVEGVNCGPGLIIRIRNALAAKSKAAGNAEGGTRNKPGSRPPGWNADASDLLADILTPGRWTGADLETLADWRRQARTILGFAIPSIGLTARCFVCGEYTLRVARDADSDVWCASAECHDDEKYPECAWVDELGYDPELGYGTPGLEHWDCRRTVKSLVHSHRWRRNSWAPIWQEMQAEKAELLAVSRG